MCEQYHAMILTAEFKPSIKSNILGAELKAPGNIKDLALKTETLEMENKTKNMGFKKTKLK
jgi:hypothetical protein